MQPQLHGLLHLAGEQGGPAGPIFGQDQHEAMNMLQLLMVSLTRLQLAAQHDGMHAVLQVRCQGRVLPLLAPPQLLCVMNNRMLSAAS